MKLCRGDSIFMTLPFKMSRMEMATFSLWLVFDGSCHFIVFGFSTSHPVFLASDMLLVHNFKKKSLKGV